MLSATSCPLICLGLNSAKYIGTTIEAIPIPNPTTNLPNMRQFMVGDSPIISAPKVNIASASIITNFLPTASDKGPAIKLPKKAPS